MNNISVTDGKIIRQYNPENGCFYHIGRDGNIKAVLQADYQQTCKSDYICLVDPLTKQKTEELKTEIIFIVSCRKIYAGGVWEYGIKSRCFCGITYGVWTDNEPITPTIEEEITMTLLRQNEIDKEQNQIEEMKQKEKAILTIFEGFKNLPKLPQLLEDAIKKENRNKFFGGRSYKIIFNISFVRNIDSIKDDWKYDIIKYLWDHKHNLQK